MVWVGAWPEWVALLLLVALPPVVVPTLEGLAAAHRVAVLLRDPVRSERYRVAIGRVLRHAMQLQFADELDMFLRLEARRGARRDAHDAR